MNNLNEKWESGELGRDEQFVAKGTTTKADMEEMLGLQPISIRLSKTLIQDLKDIAQIHGLGYQPLIKQILNRFVDAEKRMLANEKIAEEIQKMEEDNQKRKTA